MDTVIRNALPSVFDFIDFTSLNYGEVLSFITPETRKIARHLEKLLKKKESLIIGEKFLQICLREGLLPKFTNFNNYDWTKWREFYMDVASGSVTADRPTVRIGETTIADSTW